MNERIVREQSCVNYECLYNLNYWCQCKLDSISPNDDDCIKLTESIEDHKFHDESA